MSRFYISLKQAPKVIIEFTNDLEDFAKPAFLELFGTKFLSAETKTDNILRYEFVPDSFDFAEMERIMKSYYESKVVKSIDVDINHN